MQFSFTVSAAPVAWNKPALPKAARPVQGTNLFSPGPDERDGCDDGFHANGNGRDYFAEVCQIMAEGNLEQRLRAFENVPYED
jgi:hypothetical protein